MDPRNVNWRWLAVPAAPTVSVMHTRWLCYIAHQPWPSDGAMTMSVVGGLAGMLLAAMWASREIG